MLILLIPFRGLSSHIFGGNLELKQVDLNTGKFRITMGVYIDINSTVPSELAQLQLNPFTVSIFRKRDNQRMADITLPFKSFYDLEYENLKCAQLRNLKTRKNTYEIETILDITKYDDSQGYYIVWERCCRNGDIDNILLPDKAGLVLYMEFPALSIANIPVKFSSPSFPVLNGEYICSKKKFQMDFSADDVDGDLLRYSIVTPMSGHNTSSSFGALSKPLPYSPISWLSGYSESSSIKGSTNLLIDSKKGVISVVANTLGLFIFTVQVEKIRDGKVIGLVRHDFQLPVVDCIGNPPPIPVITIDGKMISEVEVCKNQSVVLSTDTNPNWNFQWQKEGDNIKGAKSNTITVSDTGTYTVVKSFKNICANDTASKDVKIKSISTKIITGKNDFCDGDSLTLKVQNPKSNYQYYWEYEKKRVGDKNDLVVIKAGIYFLGIDNSSSSCTATKDSVKVSILAKPSVAIPLVQGYCVCGTTPITLTTTSNSNYTFEWFRNGTKIANSNKESLSVNDDGIYKVKVIDNNSQCTINSENYIVKKESRLQIPNAFTPNNDSKNDTWELFGINQYPEAEVFIYDRWGNIVYYSKGYAQAFDGTINGKELPVDVYVYNIKLDNQKPVISGSITILK